MSHLVSELELSARLGHKILIAGLAEAGKTATKRIFFLKQQAKDVDKLAATVNYERMSVVINNVPITIVDLGGQKVFLKRFLSVFSPFIFSNVKALIFLCDVANKTTRNSSVEYFESCVQKLQMYSPNAKYYVMLHKNDLVKQLPNYESIHEQLKEQFQIVSPQRLSFFRSTIYRPESVIDSFGRIIELTLPELSKSDFVEGREVGQIEEFPEKFVTLKQDQKESQPGTEPVTTTQQPAFASANAPGLDSLQNTMKGSMKPNSSSSTETPVKQDSPQVSSLQNLLKSSIRTDSDQTVTSVTPETRISEPIQAKAALSQHEILELRQKHMTEFYGVEPDDAKEIVKLDFDDVFGLAVTSGIPIKLVLKVFMNFIPLIRSQPDININNLDKNKLINIFTSFSSNAVKEEELFDFLIYSIENPNASVQEIQNKIMMQATSRYEKITGKLSTAVGSKYVDESKVHETKISDEQEKINKLVFKYSNLQLADAKKLVEANYDETFNIALTSGVSFEETLDLLLNKMPLLKEKGLNTDSISNNRLLELMTHYANKTLTTQDFYDSLIIA
ncbi:MAG: ADP-ribosylation factor-like protein, partial [Candidatus Hodarchaeales archaeon]